MGRGEGPTRRRVSVRPPGDDRPRFDVGLPGWGPPPGRWGPPPPGGWGSSPPGGWGHPSTGSWGLPSPRGWGPRGPPPPGFGPHPNDWKLPPEYWNTQLEEWSASQEEWVLQNGPLPLGWGPPGWGHREQWGPEPGPPPVPSLLPPLPPPVRFPEPIAFPPLPPPPTQPSGCVPPFGFPAFPPPTWTGEPLAEEPMLNPPPEQPEWIKALISAPPADSTPSDTVNAPEDSPSTPATTEPTKLKPDSSKTSRALGLLGKRTYEKPPPGRSTGIISFIGPTFGYIEREDLEKFTFSFDVFFGNPKAMTPGVRVHFTACKERKGQIATDVKVAPGGTDNVDPEIYEAVVSQPIVEPPPGERQYPGQVNVNLGPLRTNLSFERKDSSVTLLKDDQVLLNVLTNIVTDKRRATNIRPKIPSTFTHTQEARLRGEIVSLKDTEGVIRCEEHGELPFDVKDNFSDVDFTAEDVSEEVEFTVLELKARKQAIRIQRVKEPLLLTLCSATRGKGPAEAAGTSNFKDELLTVLKLDPELYEGIVTQPIMDPSSSQQGFPGQIRANMGPIPTNVTFDHRDCRFTLLRNDHVLINLLVDRVTHKRRAANIRPKIPFTFSYTKEARSLGVIVDLHGQEGVLKSDDHGELPFDLCENFSDSEFNTSDLHKKVEFTMAMVKSKKRAIRLRRMEAAEDPILLGQKKRKEEQERRRIEQEWGEESKKMEVAAALAAAKDKWTPLGFTVRDLSSMDDISKERFEGTVLRAISRKPPQEIKKELKEEPEEEKGQPREMRVKEELEEKGELKHERRQTEDGLTLHRKMKEEKTDEEGEQEVKTEPEEDDAKEARPPAAGGRGKLDTEMGRLVMTVDGQQKLLNFSPRDLLSKATMFDGDKVRFNIATNRESKEERATFVEILPESFEESIEQRRQGIVIEFSNDSGLIKCSQYPQLFFHMSEVIEKKKLELNEKVEFSVVPHDTAEGGHQAIRIKRFTENVFLAARKLGGLGAPKGKMTIKLGKPSENAQKSKPEQVKLKAVVKNLRAQDSKTSKRDYSVSRHHSKTYSRSKSRSPPRDQFGRVLKWRSTERDRRSSRKHNSRDRTRRHTRSRSSSSGRSRSRSPSRSKEKVEKRKVKVSKEREESFKTRREPSPSHRREAVVDDELARKKRELEELNEIIAYKKALVKPQGLDPGKRTCIDYDHGRIAVPLTEYKPVRPILKKRPGGHEVPCRSDPYYDHPYSPYEDRRYGHHYTDPYSSRPYPERPYSDHLPDDLSFEGHPSPGPRCSDRCDIHEEPYEDRNCGVTYFGQSYDPHGSYKPSQSPDFCSHPPPISNQVPTAVSLPSTSSSFPARATFRPLSPGEHPLQNSPTRPELSISNLSPPTEKPPLDRFLDMLNKKNLTVNLPEPVCVDDGLLPHERALQDGKGFSQIVGFVHEPHSVSQEVEKRLSNPKPSSSENAIEEPNVEPYNKIQNLLRTIGLKLSSGEICKLASRAQEKLHGLKFSSGKELASSPKDEPRAGGTGSVDMDHIHSPYQERSSSLEPLGKHSAPASDYEGFLDQRELEALKRAQKLCSLTKSMGSSPPTTTSRPPIPPAPANYQHLTPSVNWPVALSTDISLPQPSTSTSQGITGSAVSPQPQKRLGPPPGPLPGPPPQHCFRPPLFIPPTVRSILPFFGMSSPSPTSSGPLQPLETSMPTSPTLSIPATSSPSNCGSAISTTVARCLKVIETVKSLAAQPSPKPVKSVQFSLPVELSLSPGSLTSETDDDVKAKQKEKLDQYNQRLLEKREQQYKEMLSRKKRGEKIQDGVLTCAGKSASSEVKNVWICGHSLVYWAESRAKSPEVGMQLGMDPCRVTIWWKGTQGMTWSQLLPQLHQLKVTWPNPDVLIIHLGGNDLSTDSPTDLLVSVKKDLTSMRSIFPQCILVWSNILPRRVWRHSSDNHEVDLVRTTVNRRIQNIISELGGTSLTHDNIRCGTNTGLYRTDGVHLSPKGLDLFNLNLQDFLEKWDLEASVSPEMS